MDEKQIFIILSVISEDFFVMNDSFYDRPLSKMLAYDCLLHLEHYALWNSSDALLY